MNRAAPGPTSGAASGAATTTPAAVCSAAGRRARRTGAQRLAAPARVHDDGGPQDPAVGQPDRAGAGRPGDPSRPDLPARAAELVVEVGAQRGDVEHGVVPAQPVLGERDRPARHPGRDHRRGQRGRQLVGPAAVGGPPGRLRRGIEQQRAQPAPRGGGREGPPRGPAADDEHVRVGRHVAILAARTRFRNATLLSCRFMNVAFLNLEGASARWRDVRTSLRLWRITRCSTSPSARPRVAARRSGVGETGVGLAASPFRVDRDRIAASPFFARLAGVTQVVSPTGGRPAAAQPAHAQPAGRAGGAGHRRAADRPTRDGPLARPARRLRPGRRRGRRARPRPRPPAVRAPRRAGAGPAGPRAARAARRVRGQRAELPDRHHHRPARAGRRRARSHRGGAGGRAEVPVGAAGLPGPAPEPGRRPRRAARASCRAPPGAGSAKFSATSPSWTTWSRAGTPFAGRSDRGSRRSRPR